MITPMPKPDEIISRNFLPKNIKFYDGPELPTKNYQNCVEDITYWKTILYEGYGIRPGSTVVLYDRTIRFSYCTLFLAVLELGARLVISPDMPATTSGRTDKMDEIVAVYGDIDLFILDEQAEESELLVALARYYGKTVIFKQVFYDYEIKDHAVYEQLLTTVFAKPDDIATITTTSGSTGKPKLVPYTHCQLYRNAERNVSVYGFSSDDHACHTRNMHHPFVLTDFFMPALHKIENHYSIAISNKITQDQLEKFVGYIRDNQINQIAFSARFIMEKVMEYMIANQIKFEHEFNMIIGGQYVPKKYLNYVKQTNATKIIAILGTTETMSPVLMKHITPNEDVNTYKENFVGYPPDNAFEYFLDGQTLSVACPEWYDDIKQLDDKFEGSVETGFYHLGRDNFYRIDHVEFKLANVIETVKEVFDGEFDICMDPHYQNLYLIVWQGKIDFDDVNSNMYNKLEIKFTDFDYLQKDTYSNGFKLDQPALRNYFREKNK